MDLERGLGLQAQESAGDTKVLGVSKRSFFFFGGAGGGGYKASIVGVPAGTTTVYQLIFILAQSKKHMSSDSCRGAFADSVGSLGKFIVAL